MILIDIIKKKLLKKLKLMLGSDLCKEYVNKKKKEIKSRQNIFIKKSCESEDQIYLKM